MEGIYVEPCYNLLYNMFFLPLPLCIPRFALSFVDPFILQILWPDRKSVV